MRVYVAMYQTYCSSVDGPGGVLGVYTSEEKAKQSLETHKHTIADYLNVKEEDLEHVAELTIEEFNLDWPEPA